MNKDLLKYLSGFVTENRLRRFDEVIAHRTRHLTVVLEDIFQPHNAAAVLRSCDCFGIQDVHIIENQNKFEPNPDVELGSMKWLSLHKYKTTEECIASLKKNGYKIIVTSPHREDCTIDDLNIADKTALFFGTEMRGATSAAMKQADGFVKIQMAGFTESLNISVAAALALYVLTNRLKETNVNWKLSEKEIEDIKLQWMKNSLPKAELLEKEFLRKST